MTGRAPMARLASPVLLAVDISRPGTGGSITG
jgi:hypothetical protein